MSQQQLGSNWTMGSVPAMRVPKLLSAKLEVLTDAWPQLTA